MLEWDADRVWKWCIKTEGYMSIYAGSFLYHGVDAKLLFQLDLNDLIAIGSTKERQSKYCKLF